MGSRIISSLLAMALIFALPVFSFADGEELQLYDSGSPVASMFSLRESASVMSTRSLSLPSAPSGYEWVEVDSPLPDFDIDTSPTSYFNAGIFGISLSSGDYFVSAEFNADFYRFRVWNASLGSIASNTTTTSDSASLEFSLSSDSVVNIFGAFYKSSYDPADVELVSFSLYKLEPIILDYPDGVISSGFTYSSGIIPKSTRSIFGTILADFGNQPAGKYLVNIYHWGDSYNVIYQISDSTESVYYPTVTTGSVTTLVYNHPGGDFTLEGSFTVSNDETSVVDGTIFGGGQGSYAYIGGDITANGSLSWVFNISDIVAIPYDQASDSNFGFFAPIIGFFNDHFSNLKSFIASQIDKISGDDETKADVDNAQSSLDKEVQELGQLSNDLTTQTGNLEQQFTTDFAIPTEVLGGTDAVQQIYNFLFSSLGIFSIFIWLPVVLAVIKKLLRL